jgi:hypothetical protein
LAAARATTVTRQTKAKKLDFIFPPPSITF